jgi:hypothetical protein
MFAVWPPGYTYSGKSFGKSFANASKHELDVPLIVPAYMVFVSPADVLAPAAESSFCAYVATLPSRWKLAVRPQSCSEEVFLLLLCPEISISA